jgi:hypothetical protein
MKKVTASEARKNWFRLLDEVAAGGTVAIDRHGTRVLMVREETAPVGVPDYRELLSVPEADRAHAWGWRWEGEEGELVFADDEEPEA